MNENLNCPKCNKEYGWIDQLPITFRLCKAHGFYNILNDDGSFDLILAKLNQQLNADIDKKFQALAQSS